MKKLLYFAFFTIFAFFCAVNADTITIDWLNSNGTVGQTTTCETGDDLILPEPPTKPGYTFTGWVVYTPIEYLESTGTQYIDTGVIGNDNSRAVLKTLANKDAGFVFGARRSYENSTFVFVCTTDTHKYRSDFGNNLATFDTLQPQTEPFIINKNKNVTVLTLSDGSSVSKTNATASFTTPGTLYLFAANTNGTANISSSGLRIYYFRLWNNNILVRDMIPVLDSNGIPCMFDQVTNQFFYNAGSGNFINGPVINE